MFLIRLLLTVACQLSCFLVFFCGVELRSRWFRVNGANHTTGSAPQYVQGGTSHGLDGRSAVSILPTALAATCEYSVPLKQSPTAIERPPPCLQSSNPKGHATHSLSWDASERRCLPCCKSTFCTQLLVHTYTCTCWAKHMFSRRSVSNGMSLNTQESAHTMYFVKMCVQPALRYT